MDPAQITFAVISVIGMPVVAWTVNRLVDLGERVSKLEARKCKCEETEEA